MQSGRFNCDALTRKCPPGYDKICEGTAAVIVPHSFATTQASASVHESADNNDGNSSNVQSVFYNPAQVVNRDLSVCVIEAFSRVRQQEIQTKQNLRQKCQVGKDKNTSNEETRECHNHDMKNNINVTVTSKSSSNSGITILEALSATGLRAIRYYNEVSNVRYIIANDLDRDAVECIAANCDFNHVPRLEPSLEANAASVVNLPLCNENTPEGNTKLNCTTEKSEISKNSNNIDNENKNTNLPSGIIVNLDDANDLMHRLAMNPNVHSGQRLCLTTSPIEKQQQEEEEHLPSDSSDSKHNEPTVSTFCPLLQQELMDVVDLDPYGSASPFLDAAFRCIKEGGLMLVTSTDSPILCGNYPATCHGKYNVIPYKAHHCHEMAVRILLAALERVANKHKKYIVPLLSLHIDFYVRCFVRVYTQLAEVKLSSVKLSHVMQCTHCPAFWLRPLLTPRPTRPAFSKRQRERQPSHKAKTKESNDNDEEVNNEVNTLAEESAQLQEEAYPVIPKRQENWRATCTTLRELSLHKTQEEMEINEEEARLLKVMKDNSTEKKVNHDDSVFSNEEEANDESTSIMHKGNESHQHKYKTKANVKNRENALSCPVCGSNVAVSGPIYAAPTHNAEFLEKVLEIMMERNSPETSAHTQTVHDTHKPFPLAAFARIRGLVLTAREELARCPLFYDIQSLASYIRVRCIPTPLLVGALARLGYQCSQVHCCASGLKTNCPADVLMQVMLDWKQHDANAKTHSNNSNNKDSNVDTNLTIDSTDITKVNVTNAEYNKHTELCKENVDDGDVVNDNKSSELKRTKKRVNAEPRLIIELLPVRCDFSYDPQYDFRRNVTGVAKFVPNAPNWGPKRRHQGTKPKH